MQVDGLCGRMMKPKYTVLDSTYSESSSGGGGGVGVLVFIVLIRML